MADLLDRLLSTQTRLLQLFRPMSAALTLLPFVELGENPQRLEKRTFAVADMKYCKIESEWRLFKNRPYAVDPYPTVTLTSWTLLLSEDRTMVPSLFEGRPNGSTSLIHMSFA